MEDAMIISKSAFERGFGHGCIYKSEHIDLKYVLQNTTTQVTFYLLPYIVNIMPLLSADVIQLKTLLCTEHIHDRSPKSRFMQKTRT